MCRNQYYVFIVVAVIIPFPVKKGSLPLLLAKTSLSSMTKVGKKIDTKPFSHLYTYHSNLTNKIRIGLHQFKHNLGDVNFFFFNYKSSILYKSKTLKFTNTVYHV